MADRSVLIGERKARESLSDRKIQRERRVDRDAHRVADESAAACADDDARKECEQAEAELRMRRVESKREPQAGNRDQNCGQQNRECGPWDWFVNAHPRHRPERYQHEFVESEAGRDQDERAYRADWLKWRSDPGLFVKFRRDLVAGARIDGFRSGHQLSICSFNSSTESSSTPSCCSFSLKAGDSPPIIATASLSR